MWSMPLLPRPQEWISRHAVNLDQNSSSARPRRDGSTCSKVHWRGFLSGRQRSDQFRKVAPQRLSGLGLQIDLAAAAKRQAAKPD